MLMMNILVAGLTACMTVPPVLVGSDRDAHGCIGSAGYTYSSVRQACVRLWEEGISLLPVEQHGTYSAAAFVLEQDNYGQMELFLPDAAKPILLFVQNDTPKNWVDKQGVWKLTYTPSAWQLWEKGVLRYRSADR